MVYSSDTVLEVYEGDRVVENIWTTSLITPIVFM